MAVLKGSGLQLGDRVKIRMWMDHKSLRVEVPMSKPAPLLRASVEATIASRPLKSDHAISPSCCESQDPAPGSAYRVQARRAQEKEHAAGDKGSGLLVETVAIMVTVLLGLASYGPFRGLDKGHEGRGARGSPELPCTSSYLHIEL
jgi:hypothetical protein